MTVLHVCVRFPPAVGGVENHVYQLYMGLRSKYKIKVLCSTVGLVNDEKYSFVRRLKSHFNITNTNISLALPTELFKAKTDLIHTHTPTPWWSDLSIIIGKIRRIPTILTVHNDLHKNGAASIITNIYLSLFFPVSLKLVDRIVMINQNWSTSFSYTAKYFANNQHKIRVIPNGVDHKTFYFDSKRVKRPGQLLFVSVMDKYHDFKGLKFLLQALPTITKKHKVKLIVAGGGEMIEWHQAECNRLGVSNNVEFVGHVSHSALAKYYQESELFILPSVDTEGFGLVLLESLACGTPVITTKYAGVAAEVISNNCGVLVVEKNATDIADKVCELLDNRKNLTQMSLNGRKLVESKYTWDRVTDQVDRLYKELIKT